MKFFAVISHMKDQELSQKYRPEHLDFLKKHYEEGNVAAYGRFEDGTGGLVIYKGSTYEEVEELVKQDPYIQEGAREYEMHEWGTKAEHFA
ncbi:Uncharacterized conserved protein YciI, contains a putative active-site phosphohistidine [Alteribacillus persepolensis]|uniref:Uncharacterized conserved protein YciI, contains a putative active-site phosphohistidine n=1 Tax=Alteribacillus persepolensis TaxID=568899 RepID=A0A1G8EP52_9BACI|nr:YciI family protein [Alteribacillus persepolensis]SDH71645.1 Uncharacterized conserved protein YciI, contains a putative active-site phosphohistidine [Alteribacillus persepolensis]